MAVEVVRASDYSVREELAGDKAEIDVACQDATEGHRTDFAGVCRRDCGVGAQDEAAEQLTYEQNWKRPCEELDEDESGGKDYCK